VEFEKNKSLFSGTHNKNEKYTVRKEAGIETATHWWPMRPNIEWWPPDITNCSPMGD